jgi:putative flippase GtrA
MTASETSRLARFAAVGLVNTSLDIGLFWMLTTLVEIPIVIANTGSYSAGAINSFVLNKYWTFGDIQQRDPMARQFVRFLLFNLMGLAVSSLLIWLIVHIIPSLWAKVIATAGTLIWNYLINKSLVYHHD